MGQVYYTNFKTRRVIKAVGSNGKPLNFAKSSSSTASKAKAFIAGRHHPPGVSALNHAAAMDRASAKLYKTGSFILDHPTGIAAGISGGVTALTGYGGYRQARKAGLTRPESVAVGAVGAAGPAASYAISRKAHLGWKAGLAMDVGIGMGTGFGRNALMNHFIVQHQEEAAHPQRARNKR